MLNPSKYNTFVRPFIAILFSTVFCYGFVVGMIDKDAFVPVVVAVVMFYFKVRDEEKKNGE